MSAWPGWQQDVLGQIHAPASAGNVAFLNAWHACEGGTCENNPLNTTQEWPDASNCNAVGVKNYPHPVDGAFATAVTLQNGHYDGIVRDLQAGTFTAAQILNRNASEITTWGTRVSCIATAIGAPPPSDTAGPRGPQNRRQVVSGAQGPIGALPGADQHLTHAWKTLVGAVKDTMQHRADLANTASRSYKRTVLKLTRR